jgi:outer membrane immunogenic protein
MENAVTRSSLIGAAVLLALAAASPAHAADLSVAPMYKAPPAPLAAPMYNWSGFYLGANGGGDWGRSKWDSANRFNLSGGLVGGTAGYNWQVGHAVFGLEGDVDWTNLHGTTTTTCPAGCSTNNDWLATFRGRAGYAFDRFLPYVTGGLAVGDIRATTPGFSGATQTNAGWTVGGGVEFALTNNWTAKAEYLHVDLGNFNCGFNCGAAATNNVSLHSDVVRAGVNYRFGGGN